MAKTTGMWKKRSKAWCWTLLLTLLSSAVTLVFGPWNAPAPIYSASASYKQPASFFLQNFTTTTKNPATPALSLHDTTFDVAVSPPPVSFPPGTELHVIGVYEGQAVPDKGGSPWWAKCTGKGDKSQVLAECHQKMFGHHSEKTITVNISASSVPKVLALMAYESVNWKIMGAKEGNVRKIILAGLGQQNIEGSLEAIPIDVYSKDSSSCQSCLRQNGYFYAYEKDSSGYSQAMSKLYAITGLNATSFQGTYRSDRFFISNSMPRQLLDDKPRRNDIQLDTITDKQFIDYVQIGGKNVPLPEGSWLGLIYAKNPSTKGNDELAVLAKLENNQLAELIAIRTQLVTDGSGFPRQISCETKSAYARKIEMNEDFGLQLCSWVSNSDTPWVQPIFALAATRLLSLGITLPSFLLNSGFHKADKMSALTVFYLSNPELKGIKTPQTNALASPWNVNNIKSFPEKVEYAEDRVLWGNTWFQIFKAISP